MLYMLEGGVYQRLKCFLSGNIIAVIQRPDFSDGDILLCVPWSMCLIKTLPWLLFLFIKLGCVSEV